MKKAILVLVVAALASIASAATFTITLTAAQVSAIQYAYSLEPDKVKYPNAQAWFAAQLAGIINSYQVAQNAANAADFCTRFQGKTQAQKDAICTSLGLSAGCSCQ